MPLIEFPGKVPDLRAMFPPDPFAYKAALTELSAEGIEADFSRAEAWLKANAPGREVYLGEFGVYELTLNSTVRNTIGFYRRSPFRRPETSA
jgi:hypothetical protein